MPTSLTNARTYLRARMGLHASDQLAQDTEITYYLNEALAAVSSEADWWWLEEQTSFSTVAGTATYSLPADHKTTKFLWIGDKPLVPKQYQEIVRFTNDTATIPSFYAITDSLVRLSPTPSAVKTVYHYYIKQETPLSSGGDTPLLPTRYDGLWLSCAATMLAERMDNPQKVALHERAYERWLRRARDEARAHRGLVSIRARTDTDWG